MLLCLFGTVFDKGSKPSAGTNTDTGSDSSSTEPRVSIPRASIAPASIAPASLAPTTYAVTYSIAGTARTASLTYENAGGNTEQKANVRVPWTTTFKVERGAFLYIAAQNQDEIGAISCEIKLDGTILEQASSEGAYTIATCSGSAP